MERCILFLIELAPRGAASVLATAFALVTVPTWLARLQCRYWTAIADRDDAVIRARASSDARRNDIERASGEQPDEMLTIDEMQFLDQQAQAERLRALEQEAEQDRLRRRLQEAERDMRKVADSTSDIDQRLEAAKKWLPVLRERITPRRSINRVTSLAVVARLRRIGRVDRRTSVSAVVAEVPGPESEEDAWMLVLINAGRPRQRAAEMVERHGAAGLRAQYRELRPEFLVAVDGHMTTSQLSRQNQATA